MHSNNVSNYYSSFHSGLALIGSGLLGTVSSHPLDLLRTRLITDNTVEKSSSLIRGLSITLSLSVLRTGGIWPLQRAVQNEVQNYVKDESQANLISGAISNVLLNSCLAPFSVIKMHYMRDDTLKTYRSAAVNSYRNEGIRGFYKGLGINVVHDTVWGALYFASEPKFRIKYSATYPNNNKTSTEAASSFSAAVFSSIFTSWLDTMRIHKVNSDREKRNFVELVKVSLAPTKKNLLGTLYNISKIAIKTTVAHTSYRYILNNLDRASL